MSKVSQKLHVKTRTKQWNWLNQKPTLACLVIISCFFRMNLLSSCWTFRRLRSFNWDTSVSHSDVSRADKQQLTGKDMQTQVLSWMGVNHMGVNHLVHNVSVSMEMAWCVVPVMNEKVGECLFVRTTLQSNNYYTSFSQLQLQLAVIMCSCILSSSLLWWYTALCRAYSQLLLTTVAPPICRKLCTVDNNCYKVGSCTNCWRVSQIKHVLLGAIV